VSAPEVVDAEFLGTPCPDCAKTVPLPDLELHLIDTHGHEAD
jgi:hypothetical protein